jgi:hypothetical protein
MSMSLGFILGAFFIVVSFGFFLVCASFWVEANLWIFLIVVYECIVVGNSII